VSAKSNRLAAIHEAWQEYSQPIYSESQWDHKMQAQLRLLDALPWLIQEAVDAAQLRSLLSHGLAFVGDDSTRSRNMDSAEWRAKAEERLALLSKNT
jgi:hypothetical protein